MQKKQEIYFHLLSLAKQVRTQSEFDAVTCNAFSHYIKDNLSDTQYSMIYSTAHTSVLGGYV